MTNRVATTLFVVMSSACTALPTTDLVDDTDTDSHAHSQTEGTGPIVATPFEGAVRVTGPGQYQEGGSAGVGWGIQLNTSMPGGTSCYWGTLAGSCCYTAYRPNVSPPESNAGDIRITNLTQPNTGSSLTIFLDHAGDYDSDGDFPTWHVGDTLGVVASGSQIHPFTATVTVPPSLTGLPAEFVDVPDSGAVLHVSPAHDWTVGWTPVGAGVVRLTVWTEGSGEAECTVDDAAGQIVVPRDVLGEIAHRGGVGSAEIQRIATTPIVTEDLTASFDAELMASSAQIQF